MSISMPRRPRPVAGDAESASALAERLADELARRWAVGERVRSEELLDRYPQLVRCPEAAIELIYEEMCQARLNGDIVQPPAWFERFPQWRRQIETLLACHSLLGQYDEAVTAFTVCIVLADGRPWTYYNRGLANTQLERDDAARHDFDRALTLDPDFAAAAIERGMLSYRQRRYAEARDDFQRASSEDACAAGAAYGLALVYMATDDRAEALRQLDALFAREPDHVGGRKLARLLRGGDE